MGFGFGIPLGSAFAALGNVSVQPTPPAATAAVALIKTPVAAVPAATAVVAAAPPLAAAQFSKVSPANMFSAIAASVKNTIQLARYNFGIVKTLPIFRLDTRYSDSLPTVSAKFTPYEQLSGISSTMPEILTVSEFKPLYADNSTSITPSGDFMDAQVKLMNLRQQAILSLINDMKKDQTLAEQLDQQEGNFLLHIKNLKTRVTFLQNVQDKIDATSKLFDARDPALQVDAKSLLSQYYRQAFDDVNAAASPYPLYSYGDLLTLHGFSKSRVLGFSGTKVFLQILNESKKMLRVGSDDLLGIDPSLAGNDADPVTINRRAYKDPHVELGKSVFPNLADLVRSNINSNDAQLTSAISLLSNGFSGLDAAFASSTSEEVTYARKIRTLTREYAYSRTLADPTTVDLLKQYGYTVSEAFGNQTLFDAVYGQIGNRITDDRSSVNQNTMSSVASKIVGSTAVLTFEADYLQNDDGSTFTPGPSYYVSSALRPSDNGFSLSNAAELATRMDAVIDRYVDFLGKFNVLPKPGNRLTAQDAAQLLASDASTMVNTLYGMLVEPSTGFLKTDVNGDPIVSFLGAAATDASLRANLLLYMYCASNMAGDGLIDQSIVDSESANLQTDAFVRDDNQNQKVSATLDKLVRNLVSRYEIVSGDFDGVASIEKTLKNFDEKALLSRVVAFVVQISGVLKNDNVAISTKGLSRYSLVTDFCLVALALQVVLDSVRRYAYTPPHRNPAFSVNANFRQANVSTTNRIQTTMRQIVTPRLAVGQQALRGVSPFVTALADPSLVVAQFLPKTSLKQAVETRLNREEDLAFKTALAPLNAVKVCRDALQQFVLFLQSADAVSTLNDILRVVGDRDLVGLLGERGQVQVLSDVMDDVLSRVDPASSANADMVNLVSLQRSVGDDDDLKMFDDSFVTSKSVNVLKAALADAEFNVQRGSNIRLMSVGLPHGFSGKLRNAFKISAFAEQITTKPKQNDVVVLDVYKVDVRYPDLVFKPISKVFELSRFAVRNEKQFPAVAVGAGLNAALDAVPTKDYSNFANPIVTTGGANKVALDANYSFMSSNDVIDMVRNHSLSYLLELYFRLVTGIPASERELYISDPDDADAPAPFITKAILQNAADKVFEVPIASTSLPDLSKLKVTVQNTFSAAALVAAANGARPVSKINVKSAASLEALPFQHYAQLVAQGQAASDAGKKRTVYSDPEQTAKRLLSPKLFERVFFLAIDPDDFEIDYDETLSSPVGQDTFSKLQLADEIVTVTETVGNEPRDTYKVRDLKSTQQELVFEKYFVTVRSYTRSSTRRQ